MAAALPSSEGIMHFIVFTGLSYVFGLSYLEQHS